MTCPGKMSNSMNDALILIVEDNPDDAALIQAVFDVSSMIPFSITSWYRSCFAT